MFKIKKKPSNANARTSMLLVNNKHSQFDYSEVYRQIRTSIEFSNIGKKVNVVNITSSKPGEGKTTTAVNLALIYATIYEKVLLIDCDLRKPQVHKYFRLTNKIGLSDLLLDYSKTGEFDEKIFRNVRHEIFKDKLTVLTSGSNVPNPTETLSTDAFKDLIAKVKDEYDMVIVDCSPIGATSDAVPIGNTVDGTIFVVSSKQTPRKEAKNALGTLKSSGCNIIGTVLTQSDVEQFGYYYYSYNENK
ncbi:MAG: CpsD/CapB family tyrosine-protein kinase [Erysipelotrichaceae bacterium]|nr:CpsD/CapB family tyrosine-protein kinase [Erysipelotrichaceae bacterium]